VAALLYTSWGLLNKVLAGGIRGEAFVGNLLMGVVGFFLVICALILGYEGIMAFKRLSALKAEGAPAKV
jgi:ABC-type thiamin/hydroxymethylpyrimidine transport system permease subunit